MQKNRLIIWIQRHPGLDYLVIFLMSLHTIIWFCDGMLYFQGDSGIPYSPLKNLNMLYTWWERQLGFEGWAISLIPIYLFFAFLEKIGLSLVVSQDIYILIAKFVAGCGMYYLTSTFTSSRKICLLSSFLYLFSSFQLGLIFIYVYLPYVFIPLILGLYIKGIHSNSNSHILLCSLMFIPLTCDFPNYRHYFIMTSIIVFYTVFYCCLAYQSHSLSLKTRITIAIKLLFLCGIINTLLTSLYALPIYFLLKNAGASKLLSDIGISFGDYGWATIVNVMRIRGNGAYNLYTNLANNPFLILFSYYIPILVFFTILFRKKAVNGLYFLWFITILFLFICKGNNPPLGKFYEWAVTNITLARAFRTSWLSILPVVIMFSILVSISIWHIYDYLLRKSRVLAFMYIIFSISLILLSSYPLVTGSYVQSPFSPDKSGGYMIPNSYYQIEKYLTSNLSPEERLLKLPQSEGYMNTVHSWNYWGSNIIPFIFSKHAYLDSYILPNTSRTILEDFYDDIKKHKFDDKFERSLRKFSIRYILIDGYEENYKFNLEAPKIVRILKQNNSFSFIGKFDRLYLFKCNYKSNNLHIYGKV